MDNFFSFVHLIFVGLVALFPPVNPVGTAFIIDPFLHHLEPVARKAASRRIAFYCFAICTTSLLVGSWLLKLFGISIPVVQLAGGILICKMGWQLLSSDGRTRDSSAAPDRATAQSSVEGILFYPLAFPMTTGAGTISVLLTLSAHAESTGDWTHYMVTTGALIAASFVTCVMIYFCYAFTPALLKRLGPRGGQILDRLSAFLVFCVGIQIAIGGITHLLHPK